jgi:hypothetical protein
MIVRIEVVRVRLLCKDCGEEKKEENRKLKDVKVSG